MLYSASFGAFDDGFGGFLHKVSKTFHRGCSFKNEDFFHIVERFLLFGTSRRQSAGCPASAPGFGASAPVVSLPSRRALAQEAQESRDDHAVEEVDEQAAHQRHHEEGAGSGAVVLGHSLHIGHGIRCGTHSKATGSGNENRYILIPAHDIEFDEICENTYEYYLC